MDNLLDTVEIKSQLKEKELTSRSILDQIAIFKAGIQHLDILEPCTVGNGVLSFSDAEITQYINIYNDSINTNQTCKFVPASGAATRMFKDILSEYSNAENFDVESSPHILKLIENLPDFAFYEELKTETGEDIKKTVEKILFDAGLNYSKLPKGLIRFHKYADSSRTAFDEHLVEAGEYTADETGNCNIHFTVPPEYKREIEQYLEDKKYDFQHGNIKFNLSYSVQNPSTDTIAVDLKNQPVTDDKGLLIFRPAGHGALIENLNSIDTDIIFIKNVDNVTTDKFLPDTVRYKKVIGGYLISIKNEINKILFELEDVHLDNERLKEILHYCKDKLRLEIPDNINTEELTKVLNRPVRVCGVVKNEGEPGGGPFWVKRSGILSKQIVESAQVNMVDIKQRDIWNSSTHFNPVDIVCSVRDYKGNKYNLNNFIDTEAGIITKKSLDGKEIKALELPGLWNGAMADWITYFVEVPLITFNPVKTVFDLLKREHQN